MAITHVFLVLVVARIIVAAVLGISVANVCSSHSDCRQPQICRNFTTSAGLATLCSCPNITFFNGSHCLGSSQNCTYCPAGYTVPVNASRDGANVSSTSIRCDRCILASVCTPSTCPGSSYCIDLPADSYYCVCGKGFRYNGTHCVSVITCSPGSCPLNSLCGNGTGGGLMCRCTPGYNDTDSGCVLVNACMIPDVCHANATCVSTLGGSVACRCSIAVTRVNTITNTSTDTSTVARTDPSSNASINEMCNSSVRPCALLLCHRDATCQVDRHGFKCMCRSGLSGNGTACWNISTMFCEEETLVSTGFGTVGILWPRTGQGQSVSVDCPITSLTVVTGFGVRCCGGETGTPTWQQPTLSLCLLKDLVAQIHDRLNLVTLDMLPSIKTITNTSEWLKTILNIHAASVDSSSADAAAKLLEAIGELSTSPMDLALDESGDTQLLSVLADYTKLLKSVADVADQLNQVLRNLNSTASSSMAISIIGQRIAKAVETVARNAPLPEGNDRITLLSKTTHITIICPNSSTMSVLVNFEPLLRAWLSAESLPSAGLPPQSAASLLQFKIPLAVQSASRAEGRRYFDCERPKVTFIAHRGDVFFQDTRLRNTSKSVGSSVLSAKVGSASNIQLTRDNATYSYTIPAGSFGVQCVFWDRNISGWSTQGCTLKRSDGGKAECSCNHLTDFSILYATRPENPENPGNTEEQAHIDMVLLTSNIGCSLSIVSLMVTAAVCLFAKTSTSRLHFKLMALFSLSLLVTLTTFLAVSNLHKTLEVRACTVLGMLQHLSLLVAIGMLVLQATNAYKSLKAIPFPVGEVLKCSILVFAVSIAIVVSMAGISGFKPYDIAHKCWFSKALYVYIALLCPVLLVTVGTAFFLVMVLRENNSKERLPNAVPALSIMAMALFLLLLVGCSWSFAALLSFFDSPTLHYIFAVVVSFQGVIVIIAHLFAMPVFRSTILFGLIGRYSVRSQNALPECNGRLSGEVSRPANLHEDMDVEAWSVTPFIRSRSTISATPSVVTTLSEAALYDTVYDDPKPEVSDGYDRKASKYRIRSRHSKVECNGHMPRVVPQPAVVSNEADTDNWRQKQFPRSRSLISAGPSSVTTLMESIPRDSFEDIAIPTASDDYDRITSRNSLQSQHTNVDYKEHVAREAAQPAVVRNAVNVDNWSAKRFSRSRSVISASLSLVPTPGDTFEAVIMPEASDVYVNKAVLDFEIAKAEQSDHHAKEEMRSSISNHPRIPKHRPMEPKLTRKPSTAHHLPNNSLSLMKELGIQVPLRTGHEPSLPGWQSRLARGKPRTTPARTASIQSARAFIDNRGHFI